MQNVEHDESDEPVPLKSLERELFRPWRAKLATERTVAYQEHYKRLLKTWPLEDEEGLAKRLSSLQAKLGV